MGEVASLHQAILFFIRGKYWVIEARQLCECGFSWACGNASRPWGE